tara:strand:+ start:1799 stop:2914 length:1116 start_codon:yes stop_codon:yes gene_type:complete
MLNKARIAVNLLHVVPGEVGGSEEYSVETLRAVAESKPKKMKPVIHASEAFFHEYPDIYESFETEIYRSDSRNRPKRIMAESTAFKARAKGVQGVHHFGGYLPLLSPRPAAVTVHDLQPLDIPKNFSLLKRLYFKFVLPKSIKRADLVVTVSDAVSEQIHKKFEISKEHLRVVPIGIKRIRTEHTEQIGPPTILYPASTYPHKNHVTLIKAFARLSDKNPEVRLVFTGAPGKAELQVRKEIEKSGVGQRISLLGRVSSQEMEGLLNSASIMAFPSTYEGFGIPVLEAMAAGIPVVAARGTPAANLLGKNSLTVQHYDDEAWSVALSKLLNDKDLRDRLVLEGFKQANKYTYQNSAQQLLETWHQLVAIRRK